MIPIIFEVAQRPVGAPLFDIFCCTDCESVILHFPSYITARAIVIQLDSTIISCRDEMALKRELTSVNASVTILGLSSASSLSSMACVLDKDVVSVLKLAQALWMFARMPSLPSSRLTLPGSRSRRLGKSTQIWQIQFALLSPICSEERGYVLRSGHAKLKRFWAYNSELASRWTVLFAWRSPGVSSCG